LDIFVVLVQQAPRNSFLMENSDKVTAILAPCFTRIRPEGDRGIRQKLRDFLLPVFANAEQQILDDVAIFRVKVLLETLIIETDGFDADSQSTPSSVQKGLRDRPVSQDEKRAGGSCLAHFSVAIIEEASVSSPSIVETFSSSLLSLAEKLCAKHLQDAASNQRQGNLYPKQGGKTRFRQKRPTPVAGIFESACSPTSISDVIHSAAKASVSATETDWSKEIPSIGTALRSLNASLRLLGSSSIPRSFSQNRATLFRIFSNILESSDNVQVIMTAVGVVRKWLLAGTSNGPFTSKERRSFLWKIASFDLNGLPDVALQPIADIVAGTVMDLHGLYADNEKELSEDDDISLGRALVACSINANPRIRSLILRLFCNSLMGGEGSGCFRVRSPLDLLWQLTHSDFNCLGSRMWTIVFVEVLLEGCSLRPVSGKDVIDPTTSESHSSVSESWWPLPKIKTTVEGTRTGVRDHISSFYGAIISDKSQERLEDCLAAVSTLAHGDYSLCQNMFESLLPAVWRRLPNDESRLAIMQALESLLSQPYHAQFVRAPRVIEFDTVVPFNGQQIRGINSVRFFLRAILKLRPLPFLDSNILATMAEKYNSWHEVLTLLSYQYEVLSGQSLGDKGEQLSSTILSAIRHGFQQLGESRIGMTLASTSCVMPETKHAISLDTYDMVKEALDSYSALVDIVETTDETLSMYPTDYEMDLWEERWISLQREMCQLSIVSEYASSSGDPHLLLESAWKSQDWDKVRALCSSSTLLPAIEDGDPSVKMGEILLAINEGKLNEVESLHVQTAQLCLYKWQLLPVVSTGSFAHASLLHMFHRLVELRESGQIMVETSNHSKRRTLPDLKNLLR
jgi:transformation/transcription domain-associated protein